MIGVHGDTDVARFREVVTRHMGLAFDETKAAFLADVLGARLRATGLSAEAYLASLDPASTSGEVATLAKALTVPETYFFRNHQQFTALAERAIPDLLRDRRAPARLAILSAGCATGEEPYTLAMLLQELSVRVPVAITGIDVNPAALQKARAGRYSSWALRETPADTRKRWFRPQGRDFVLDEALRSPIRLEERNLAQPQADLWQPESYDVIFFRNVMMYFAPETARRVIASMTVALRPGGYLFLGHAETLRGLSADFHLRHTHDTFYYQRQERHARSTAIAPTAVDHLRSAGLHGQPADSWMADIQRASARIEALTTEKATAVRPSPAPAAPWNLDGVRELLSVERYTEALDLLRQLPPESTHDANVLLLRAVLHAHRGCLTDAEAACRQLLDVDELNAGAHYVLALCHEGAGDRAAATHHDQVASYLDPGFAMPHLHLGLLARRGGDRAAAQRAFIRALPLLEREDPVRVQLFGGGFSRDALVALCRTGLQGAGAAR